MFSFFGQSKINLLLIDVDEVIHLRWKAGRLTQIARYGALDADFDRFHVFLENDSKTPFAIIADVIEEDFRIENAAHVTGSDRRAMVARKLNNFFRGTPFRTARVIGREKVGRKDDRILFTALTKPEMFEPWIARILAQKIPVLAVTSAVYLMEHFAHTLTMSGTPHLLIVNQEINSGLRQTYLQNGRVIFGRLTPAGVSRSDNFSELLIEQCEQTRNYLERIKQLPYDAPLQVYVFTPEAFTNERESTKNLLQFHYGSIAEMPLTGKIEIESMQPGAVAYSLVSSLRKNAIQNVYAPDRTLRYQQFQRIKALLYSVSAITIFATAIAVWPTLVDVFAKLEQQRQLIDQTAPLLVEYEKLTERFPETPIQSAQMEIVVETHDRIAGQAIRPAALLALISEGLAMSPDLELLRIVWDLEAVTRLSNEGEPIDDSSLAAFLEVPSAVVNGNSQLVITVYGSVQSEVSFRDATEQVMVFVRALKGRSGYEVTPLSLPVDASSNINFATTVDGGTTRGEFTIEIRRER